MRPINLVFIALGTPTTDRQGPMTTPPAQVDALCWSATGTRR
jgi:hypothetical protein